MADGKLNNSSAATEIAPPSHLSHEPSELRVKKSDKPAKFFKSAKKEKVPATLVSSEEASTRPEVLPHQMNGKHSEKEDEEDVDDDSVPSSAKKRKKGDKKAKSKAVVDTESDASASETEQQAAKQSSETKVQAPGSKNNALDNIPNDFRFDPKNLANKPKGLVDALSSFFTPGLKRTSRTAMNSLLKPETVPKESPLAADSTSGVAAKVDEVKKVRLSVDEKETSSKKDVNEDAKNEERKRHASAGQQQVKSLYDGLSHLYADCDSRLRSAPNSEKGGSGKGEEKEDEEEEEEKGEEKENKGASSPNRLSDGESKEKEDPKKEGDKEKPEEGDKVKGSSKTK